MTTPRKKPAARKATAKRPPAGGAQRAKRVSLSSADDGQQRRQTRIQGKARNKQSDTVAKVIRALTAAATLDAPAGGGGVVKGDTASQAWHRACFAYARTVPELGAAKLYVGNCLAQIKLRLAKRNADGSIENGLFLVDDSLDEQPDESPDAPPPDPDAPAPELIEMANDVISTMRASYGGQSELLRSYGEKMFLAGDLWLLPVDVPGVGMTLDALSTLELKREGEKYVRLLGPGGDEQDIPPETPPARVWRRDAEYSYLSTSSVQACLEVLEELVILTRLVRSAAIQRLALSGILAIADDFDDPIDEEGEDGQTSELTNPLATDIIETGAKAIDDPSSAASWLPYILQGPLEAVERGIRLIRFEGDDALQVVKRREALERLAQGVDLPMESVLGHQGTTYANAAQISEDRFKIHIEPMVAMLCDALTVLVLWPALAKKMGVKPQTVIESGYPAEITAVAVGYDADQLISRPSRAQEIIEVVKIDKGQIIVRIAEIREAIGLDPDTPPTPEETARRVAAYRDASAKESIQQQGDTSAEIEGDVSGATAAAAQLDSTGVVAAAAIALNVAERIAGAMEVTVERAAQRVGARVRSKLNGNAKHRDLVKDAANKDVARLLGPRVTARYLGGDNPAEAELGELAAQVARWALEIGVEDPGALASAIAERTATAIQDRLYGTDSLSADTLLDVVAKHAARGSTVAAA